MFESIRLPDHIDSCPIAESVLEIRYNNLYNNFISLNSVERVDPIIPMETIKKIRIKIARPEKLEILSF